MRSGLNQYPPMAGVPRAARGGGAQDRARCTATRYDPGDEITITAGATQAILTAILAVVHPGDEVIVLDPCYDSYVPNIELAGGRVVRVALDAGHLPARLRRHRRGHHAAHARDHRQHAAQPERHRVDGAPTCERLAELLRPTDVLLIADEVYEHMVYDGARACQRCRAIPSWPRARFVVSSFGKTYHVTGWKVGYVAAPARADRRVPQGAPVQRVHRQHADAARPGALHGTTRDPTWSCPRSISASATCSAPAWQRTRLRLLPSEGSYFQCVDYSAISDRSEEDFCRWLTTRDRRGCDPAVGVLRRRPQSAAGALLLRQARRDAERGARAAGASVAAPARRHDLRLGGGRSAKSLRWSSSRRNTWVSSSIGSGLVRSTSTVP